MKKTPAEVENAIASLKQSLEAAKKSLLAAEKWIDQLTVEEVSEIELKTKTTPPKDESNGLTVVYGVFNGKAMETETGKTYIVPANYASKSKLIEGDSLKLTILSNGSMLYKQIEIADRELMQGSLILDMDKYKVLCNDRLINVPYASITFFRVKVGDLVTVIVPKDESKSWGAIESVESID